MASDHNKRKQHNEPMRTKKQIHVTSAKRGKTRATILVLHLIGRLSFFKPIIERSKVKNRSISLEVEKVKNTLIDTTY